MFDRISQGLWWDKAWSLVSGCTPVSPACANCWAARETYMRACHPNEKIRARAGGLVDLLAEDMHPVFNSRIRLNHDFLDKPLRTKKPTAWAIWNDLFHEDVPGEFIDKAFAVIALCPQHTFIVLTKRPDQMERYMKGEGRYGAIIEQLRQGMVWGLPYQTVSRLWRDAPREDVWPLPNVWLGVTAEDQQAADERIPILLQTPAAVRFVSVEPMLGSVDLTDIRNPNRCPGCLRIDALSGKETHEDDDFRWTGSDRLNWVICGGESGSNARPIHLQWARDLRNQCQDAGTPFFFKQWGEWAHVGFLEDGGEQFQKVGKKAAGRLLDGKEWLEYPEVKANGA